MKPNKLLFILLLGLVTSVPVIAKMEKVATISSNSSFVAKVTKNEYHIYKGPIKNLFKRLGNWIDEKAGGYGAYIVEGQNNDAPLVLTPI